MRLRPATDGARPTQGGTEPEYDGAFKLVQDLFLTDENQGKGTGLIASLIDSEQLIEEVTSIFPQQMVDFIENQLHMLIACSQIPSDSLNHF